MPKISRLFEWNRLLLGRLASFCGIARDHHSQMAALRRSLYRDGSPGSIIDIGASNGCWSKMAHKVFPKAHLLLIEAQEEHRSSLEHFVSKTPNSKYLISAAGNIAGNAYFDAQCLYGGLASHEPVGPKSRVVPMVTIDDAVNRFKLSSPYILKLDTHGFEVPILDGAADTLSTASLVIIEVYNFRLTNSSLKFYEMCAFMESKGFFCIDLAEPMHRPGDKALWQMDLFFVPSTNGAFAYNCYEAFQ